MRTVLRIALKDLRLTRAEITGKLSKFGNSSDVQHKPNK